MSKSAAGKVESLHGRRLTRGSAVHARFNYRARPVELVRSHDHSRTRPVTAGGRKSGCPGSLESSARRGAGASLGQGWGNLRASGSANLSSSGTLTTIGSGFERVTTQTVG